MIEGPKTKACEEKGCRLGWSAAICATSGCQQQVTVDELFSENPLLTALKENKN